MSYWNKDIYHMKETSFVYIGIDILNCIKGKQSSGWYMALKSRNLLAKLSELTKFLNRQYDDISFLQRMWHVINNDYTIQKCKNDACENNALWVSHGSNKLYGCCSVVCSGKVSYKNGVITNKNNHKGELACNTDEHKEKIKLTSLKKYGVEHPSNTNLIREKIAKTTMLRMNTNTSKLEYRKIFVDLNKELYEYPYELIDYPKSRIIQFKHHICGYIFNIHHSTLESRIKNNIELCTICKPINLTPKISCGENELFMFIKSVYVGPIELRTRKLIYPHEIDIFLPELKLAFEYNGDYWHANPEKYGPDDIIWRNKASEVWARDKRKIDRCIKDNIKLMIIWESEWKNNKVKIENIINSMLC